MLAGFALSESFPIARCQAPFSPTAASAVYIPRDKVVPILLFDIYPRHWLIGIAGEAAGVALSEERASMPWNTGRYGERAVRVSRNLPLRSWNLSMLPSIPTVTWAQSSALQYTPHMHFATSHACHATSPFLAPYHPPPPSSSVCCTAAAS